MFQYLRASDQEHFDMTSSGRSQECLVNPSPETLQDVTGRAFHLMCTWCMTTCLSILWNWCLEVNSCLLILNLWNSCCLLRLNLWNSCCLLRLNLWNNCLLRLNLWNSCCLLRLNLWNSCCLLRLNLWNSCLLRVNLWNSCCLLRLDLWPF